MPVKTTQQNTPFHINFSHRCELIDAEPHAEAYLETATRHFAFEAISILLQMQSQWTLRADHLGDEYNFATIDTAINCIKDATAAVDAYLEHTKEAKHD